MIQVSVKSIGDPCGPMLDGFRQYLAAPDTGDDRLLKAALKSAMIAVQEWEDRSLLPETVAVVVAARPDPRAPITLYRTVSKIVSVTDADGKPLDYSRCGKLLQVTGPCRNAEVVYETSVDQADVDALLLKVYRVAAARYDGEDAQTINRIIMEG